MKAALLFVCSALLSLSCFAQNASPVHAEPSAADRAKLTELVNRVEKGDNTALADAAKERTTFAIGFIKRYIRNPGAQQYVATLAALKTVDGYADYYQKKLADTASRGGIDEDAFKMLGLVGTPAAQAVVAPYLFDWTTLSGGGS